MLPHRALYGAVAIARRPLGVRRALVVAIGTIAPATICGLCAAFAIGQAPPPQAVATAPTTSIAPIAPIDGAIKIDKTFPLPRASADQVRVFVKAQAAQLTASDNASVARAREALSAAAQPPKGEQLSAAYKFVLDRALAETLAPILAGKNMRGRINAAIIIARAAEASPYSADLDKTIAAILGEKKGEAQPELVVLWGMKAARGVIVQSLSSGRETKILKQVARAAVADMSGPVVEEAYDALIVDDVSDQNMIAKLVPELLNILEARVAACKKALPQDPHIEAVTGGLFPYLYRPRNWDKLPPETQVRVVGLTNGLLNGVRDALIAQPQQPQPVIDSASMLVTETGKNITVLGQHLRDEAIQAAGQSLVGIPPHPTAQQVIGVIKNAGLEKALGANPAFKDFARADAPPASVPKAVP